MSAYLIEHAQQTDRRAGLQIQREQTGRDSEAGVHINITAITLQPSHSVSHWMFGPDADTEMKF